jgi:hypothetical protein
VERCSRQHPGGGELWCLDRRSGAEEGCGGEKRCNAVKEEEVLSDM